jgi:hypothetical protein
MERREEEQIEQGGNASQLNVQGRTLLHAGSSSRFMGGENRIGEGENELFEGVILLSAMSWLMPMGRELRRMRTSRGSEEKAERTSAERREERSVS